MAYTRETLEKELMDLMLVNGVDADLSNLNDSWHEFCMDMNIEGTESKGWLSAFCVDMYDNRVEISVTQMEIVCKYEDILSVEFTKNRRLRIELANGTVIRSIKVA